jgi:hypothetical protein
MTTSVPLVGYESGNGMALCPDKRKPWFDPSTGSCIPAPKGKEAQEAFLTDADIFYDVATEQYISEEAEKKAATQRGAGQSFWDRLFPPPRAPTAAPGDAGMGIFFSKLGGAQQQQASPVLLVGGLAAVGLLAWFLMK